MLNGKNDDDYFSKGSNFESFKDKKPFILIMQDFQSGLLLLKKQNNTRRKGISLHDRNKQLSYLSTEQIRNIASNQFQKFRKLNYNTTCNETWMLKLKSDQVGICNIIAILNLLYLFL